MHPVKKNKQIYFVIYDKATQQVLYAGYGMAYGEFIFKIVTMVSDKTQEDETVGDLKMISSSDGATCEEKHQFYEIDIDEITAAPAA